ncbi:ornithine carbamoyltransferase [bacterium]|jgi:ornithine carbamoyltransferase|nr:ornithine carbamoyltransferase [bacterium]
MRHLCSLLDLNRDELAHLVRRGIELKADRGRPGHSALLAGRILGLVFEKPSMRTRVSFEAAIGHCGGSAVFMTQRELGLGERESVKDFARVASQYLDVLAARTFSHERILELAMYSSCPVINALSDREHPCQILADLCTIAQEFGTLAGKRIVFVGDGNNVALSLAHAAVLSDIEFVLSAPEGFGFRDEVLKECFDVNPQAKIILEPNPQKAVTGAHVVYTDVWASMGQESEADERRKYFLAYQVDARLMKQARSDARFMHCLPAHRGDEVTDEVIDSPASLIVEQAGYRLHAQKALILWLLGIDKS